MNNTLMQLETNDSIHKNTRSQVAQASKLLVNFFDSVLVLASKPSFTLSNDSKVVINVFYYAPKNKALSDSAINSVGKVLSKLFSSNNGLAQVELRLVRLHYPYLNSYILAQYIAINTAKYNFTRIISRLWGANIIFSEISSDKKQVELLNNSNVQQTSCIKGVKVKVSGRLVTQRSVPRKTVETAQIGTFSCSKVDSASFTSKNKKGAFTVKVWISL